MSGRLDFKGFKGRQNDKSLRKFVSTPEKPSLPKSSSSLLYNNIEFPSLSESLNNPDSEVKTLKYSDKLKLSSQNQSPYRKLFSSKDSQPKNFSDRGTVKYSSLNENNCNDTKVINDKKSDLNYVGVQNQQLSQESYASRTKSIQSSYVNPTMKEKDVKIPSTKQTNFVKSSSHTNLDIVSNKASALKSNISLKSNVERQCNKEIHCKLILDKNLLKNEEEKDNAQGKAKKKKKRKSKIKRQAAMQTGKITVLTPEVHSKILNQSSALNSQNKVIDINDEEEYPELGKPFKPSCLKENTEKKESISVGQVKEKISDAFSEELQFTDKEISLIADKTIDVKKIKSDKVVHPSDPITVTFFDILVTRNPKAKGKDIKDEVNTPAQSNPGFSKTIPKKNASHAPNSLDSSKPAVKRGKERENPKPKKPSHLKKIILLDRKLRREQLLQLRINSDQSALGNESEAQQNLNDVLEVSVDAGDVDEENISETICDLDYSEVSSDVFEENDTTLLQSSDTISSRDIQNGQTSEATVSISVSNDSADKKDQNGVCKISANTADSEKHLNVLESNDSLLKSLSGDAKSFENSEKEKAAKILLHTRNFREYCNHLVSKDIDDAVHSLLDDLARFQDRMHQKDPVKARIKRRMIYGVKEVKKHIKIKKLKCIIIATDIENVETEGGLNDILNDIKSLAADHNIPCAFALSRKALGKVCRKPVPVSCIGIFNFEGSEVNFKKIVELLTVSKRDYADMLNNLTMKITEEEAVTLFRAKKEAPETLHDIRSNILRDYLLPAKNDDAEQLNASGTSETESL